MIYRSYFWCRTKPCKSIGCFDIFTEDDYVKEATCPYCNVKSNELNDIKVYSQEPCTVENYLYSIDIKTGEKIRRELIGSTPQPQQPTKTQIECPYCHNKNCSKIGIIGRGLSFGLFGFGSSKVGKQWHCNTCKSDF